MQSAGIPDADLVIRSGGERRLSNFLLWQAAYAELVFTDKLWPDFGAEDLKAALAEFARRERRFGAISATERARAESSFSDSAVLALSAEVFDAE
jgi:undecaprenyl diphosphate synthase